MMSSSVTEPLMDGAAEVAEGVDTPFFWEGRIPNASSREVWRDCRQHE